jgi:hypothetical protein
MPAPVWPPPSRSILPIDRVMEERRAREWRREARRLREAHQQQADTMRKDARRQREARANV